MYKRQEKATKKYCNLIYKRQEKNTKKYCNIIHIYTLIASPGCVAQSVTYLSADTCQTADPEVTSSIPARSHTFVEIDHEIISTVILLPSADLRRVIVRYKRQYVHEVLVHVNCVLVKLAKEKECGRVTLPWLLTWT